MKGIRAELERLRAEAVAAYPQGFLLRDYDQGFVDALDAVLDLVKRAEKKREAGQ